MKGLYVLLEDADKDCHNTIQVCAKGHAENDKAKITSFFTLGTDSPPACNLHCYMTLTSFIRECTNNPINNIK